MVIFVILRRSIRNYLFQRIGQTKIDEKMDKIRWTNEFSSGLNYLDNHRRNYLEIVNELIDIFNSKNCATRLPLVFHRLAFYIEDYFAKKEMAIREAPGLSFSEYKKEHHRFTTAIIVFQDRFSQGETDICQEIIEFMMEWLKNYITRFGTEAPDYMRTKGYE
jgi:hemerythrin-like metal-binding protein